MNKLNNKGQALVMFVCLIPVLILIIGIVVDTNKMVYEKSKLENINALAVTYYLNHIEEDDVTNKMVELIKKNDNSIENINIDKINKEIFIDKKVDSIFGNIIGIKEYNIVSIYTYRDNIIKRVK